MSELLADGIAVECFLCHGPIADARNVTAEHKVPIREGGNSSLANLAPAHAGCNFGWRRKRAREQP